MYDNAKIMVGRLHCSYRLLVKVLGEPVHFSDPDKSRVRWYTDGVHVYDYKVMDTPLWMNEDWSVIHMSPMERNALLDRLNSVEEPDRSEDHSLDLLFEAERWWPLSDNFNHLPPHLSDLCKQYDWIPDFDYTHVTTSKDFLLVAARERGVKNAERLVFVFDTIDCEIAWHMELP